MGVRSHYEALAASLGPLLPLTAGPLTAGREENDREAARVPSARAGSPCSDPAESRARSPGAAGLTSPRKISCGSAGWRGWVVVDTVLEALEDCRDP